MNEMDDRRVWKLDRNLRKRIVAESQSPRFTKQVVEI
jgi:hypothetical protein